MSEAKRAVCVGEAIVELARGVDGRFALASGGDTFNTAIYLARAGAPAAFASALGNDPTTSARPPVLANGAASELANRTFIAIQAPLPESLAQTG